MSRIGRQPVAIPQTVKVKLERNSIIVSGPKGELKQDALAGLNYIIEDEQCVVKRLDDSKVNRARHGLMRSLIANMVLGVTQGFTKSLKVIGIGYKVRLDQQLLILNLGFSHEVEYQAPDDVQLQVEGNTITVNGIDKQRVGLIAATIREFKKPEPYKGKGIRYHDEAIRFKTGKRAKESG